MRPIWSGTISFALVSVPVRMFSATQSNELRFHFLDRRDLTPIGYDKVRKDTGESVPADEIVRGFEIAKSLVENLSDSFKPEKYDDNYRKELLELIRAKAKGQDLPQPKEAEEDEVVDLMAALRESVERTQKKQKKPTRKRAKKAS
jgi:non-homologous end joining protein Ku